MQYISVLSSELIVVEVRRCVLLIRAQEILGSDQRNFAMKKVRDGRVIPIAAAQESKLVRDYFLDSDEGIVIVFK